MQRQSKALALAALAVAGIGVHLWGLYRPVGPPMFTWLPDADKVEHLVGFGGPLLLVLLALRARAEVRGRSLGRRAVVVVVSAFAAHGVVSELIQHFWYAHRTGDPFDTLADWIGCAVGFLTYRLLGRRRMVEVAS